MPDQREVRPKSKLNYKMKKSQIEKQPKKEKVKRRKRRVVKEAVNWQQRGTKSSEESNKCLHNNSNILQE